MSGVAGLGVDERRARVVLSLLAEPDDATTGRLLQQRGAVETLRLLDSDAAVPGLGRVDAQVWRDRFSPQEVERLSERLRTVENGGFATLIAGDVEWPRALDDLGERAPYVLFVRGATSFLARPLEDLVTVTGSRASTSYGERVASELAGDLASRERLWSLVVLLGSRVQCIVERWLLVVTRSRCWPEAWTGSTLAGITTC